jgi:hypothetical protein
LNKATAREVIGYLIQDEHGNDMPNRDDLTAGKIVRVPDIHGGVLGRPDRNH